MQDHIDKSGAAKSGAHVFWTHELHSHLHIDRTHKPVQFNQNLLSISK